MGSIVFNIDLWLVLNNIICIESTDNRNRIAFKPRACGAPCSPPVQKRLFLGGFDFPYSYPVRIERQKVSGIQGIV